MAAENEKTEITSRIPYDTYSKSTSRTQSGTHTESNSSSEGGATTLGRSSSEFNREGFENYGNYLKEANKDNPDYLKRPKTVYDLVKQIHPEPELDERKIKQANLRKKVGVIADSLRSIIDMGVTAGGGDVYARQKDNYVDEANKEIDKEQDRFTTALKNYQDLKKDALIYDREHPAKSQFEKDMEAARPHFFDKISSNESKNWSKGNNISDSKTNSVTNAENTQTHIPSSEGITRGRLGGGYGVKGGYVTLYSGTEKDREKLVPSVKIPAEDYKTLKDYLWAKMIADPKSKASIEKHLKGNKENGEKDNEFYPIDLDKLDDSDKAGLIGLFWKDCTALVSLFENDGFVNPNYKLKTVPKKNGQSASSGAASQQGTGVSNGSYLNEFQE